MGTAVAAYGAVPPPPPNGLFYAPVGTPVSALPLLCIEDIEEILGLAVADLKGSLHPARHSALEALKEEVSKRVRARVQDEVARFNASRWRY